MVPYLKGLHLTIKHWRDDRDAEGWPNRKRKEQTDEEILDTFEDDLTLKQAAKDLLKAVDPALPPSFVEPVPSRLKVDVMCLLELFWEDKPSIRCVRPTQCVSVIYGCGDASGLGFGALFLCLALVMVWIHTEKTTTVRYPIELASGDQTKTALCLTSENSTILWNPSSMK
jgi:hypothetical protein